MTTTPPSADLQSQHADDVLRISRLEAVPTILKVITEVTGLRLSLVARVTEDAWTACAVNDTLGFGLAPGDHLDVATTLCSEVRDSKQPIVIEHASVDPVWCTHPTPKHYQFESYIAVPIFLKGGRYFGNVCALDSRPARFDEFKTVEMMKLFAQLIALQMEAEQQQEQTSAALMQEQQNAELREQFIAVLGHDLRNPLSAVLMAAEILAARGLEAAEQRIVGRLLSSARRMSGLLSDIMDFARGRLGGGIPLAKREVDDLGRMVETIVEELRTARASRSIVYAKTGSGSLHCDPDRLAQVLSNLIGNALEHGDPSAPVEVALAIEPRRVLLSVKNQGKPIPPAFMTRLFQPFVRRTTDEVPQGLGLGLFIVDQIIRSHGGSVTVRSSDGETVFTCTLPRQ